MSIVAGKVACLTGGIGGIGYQIAKLLIKFGIKGITLIDIDERQAPPILDSLRRYGESRVEFVHSDVRSPYQMECALKKTVELFGNLDFVINNAAIIDENDFDLMFRVNYLSVLYGTMFSIYKYLPNYMTKEEGIVVNNACVFGLEPLPMSPVYSALKHAVVGVGRAFGTPYYYNRSKVKVMTICPGFTDTPLFSPAKLDLHCPEAKFFPTQEAKYPAICLLDMLERGQNGSVWISENGLCYEYPVQDRFKIFETTHRKNIVARVDEIKPEI